VADRPGVLAQIATVLGDLRISISSVIQKETDEVARRAELVLTTHRAKEASVQQAVRLLEALEVVNEVGNVVRIEEWD
jgi:homoserine dehydrogenase